MSIKRKLLETLDLSNELFEELNGIKYLPYDLLWGRGFQGYKRSSVRVNLHRAIDQGLVRKRLRKEKAYLALTELGRRLLEQGKDSPLILSKPSEKWDGLYRIIFFDIPEKKRLVRDSLRQKLREAGGAFWQKSVWVTKANITKDLNNFIQENAMEDFIGIVEVREIYNPKLKMLLEKF